jgi:hypothetical protein
MGMVVAWRWSSSDEQAVGNQHIPKERELLDKWHSKIALRMTCIRTKATETSASNPVALHS